MTTDARNPPPVLPTARVWLVDGYNVIHAVLLGGKPRDTWWTAPERNRLLGRIHSFQPDPPAPPRPAGSQSHLDMEVFVVFDGTRQPESGNAPVNETEARRTPRIHVQFSPSADDWLVSRVRKAEQPGEIAVVTGDRKVAGRCRHAGASVVRPRDFLAHCPEQDERSEKEPEQRNRPS